MLQHLKEQDMIVHKTFTNETKRITKIISTHHTSRSRSNYYSNSYNL